MGTHSKGALKIFIEVGHIPVKTFLLIHYFFDSTYTGLSGRHSDILGQGLLSISSFSVGAYLSIHHFDEPRTPGTGTSFGVTDLLLRRSVIHGGVDGFSVLPLSFQKSWLNPSRAK